ncbi:MAG TPA: GNAT family N-acetyltransferase [Gemmatimonadaceae bacterium]|nr:GNAT family N-acetyltransferase [Gemmatimonadaceae bacterium]
MIRVARMSAVVIRHAEQRDAAAIASLVTELGYPATAEEVRQRLMRLSASTDALGLVAEATGKVVGVATGHVIPCLHSTPIVAKLTMLCVASDARQVGVGKQLCAGIERWAEDRGAAKISVTSGLQRSGAHVFYERIGYERTGVRLTKVFT